MPLTAVPYPWKDYNASGMISQLHNPIAPSGIEHAPFRRVALVPNEVLYLMTERQNTAQLFHYL
jgi:hypothetical protein